MSDDDDLGKYLPCYGEFKCSQCKRKWNSTKSWNGYGQKCADCAFVVYPTELSKNFTYICGKCNNFWYWKYSATGKKCRNCESNITISPLDPDDSEDQKIINERRVDVLNSNIPENPNRDHRQDLCLKCITMGRPCREFSNDRTSKTATYSNSAKPSNFTNAIKSQVCKEYIFMYLNIQKQSFQASVQLRPTTLHLYIVYNKY